jgi:hypothetical protein
MIIGHSSSLSEMLEDVVDRLVAPSDQDVSMDGASDNEEKQAKEPAFVIHLFPSDVVNLQSSMKALVQGFVRQDPRPRNTAPTGGNHKQPATLGGSRNLANYDINLLAIWYDEVLRLRPNHSGEFSCYTLRPARAHSPRSDIDEASGRPQLVILVHNFETLDASVMQDVWEICS